VLLLTISVWLDLGVQWLGGHQYLCLGRAKGPVGAETGRTHRCLLICTVGLIARAHRNGALRVLSPKGEPDRFGFNGESHVDSHLACCFSWRFFFFDIIVFDQDGVSKVIVRVTFVAHPLLEIGG